MSAILFAACLVIGISDGDTVRVKCPQRKAAFQVRIAELDAPELAHKAFGWDLQPFGKESQASAAALCQGKLADVRRTGFDVHRRAVGSVSCAGTDLATYQLKRGMGWAAQPQYLPKGSKAVEYEAAARAAHVGLWAGDGQIAPWIWRKGNKVC